MTRILVLSFQDLGRDPRPNRQIRLLSSHYDVCAAGTGDPGMKGVPYIPLRRSTGSTRLRTGAMLLTRLWESFYWGQEHVRSALANIPGDHFDLILAHDVDALPLAFALAGARGRVVLDAHEYAPREFEDSFLWRQTFGLWKEYLCRRYLPRLAGMITVGPRIADEYARRYNVRPDVVWNVPFRESLSPSANRSETIRLIHHGAAIPARGLEVIIEAVQRLPAKFELDLMLVDAGRPNYVAHLKKLAQRRGHVRFVAPVPMPDICRVINTYDVGLALIQPRNFNYLNCVPNKLFEFVQARLAVASGPSPDMADVIKECNLGAVSASFTATHFADTLLRLSPERIRYHKQAANKAAEVFCFEVAGEVLLDVVRRALASSPAGRMAS